MKPILKTQNCISKKKKKRVIDGIPAHNSRLRVLSTYTLSYVKIW